MKFLAASLVTLGVAALALPAAADAAYRPGAFNNIIVNNNIPSYQSYSARYPSYPMYGGSSCGRYCGSSYQYQQPYYPYPSYSYYEPMYYQPYSYSYSSSYYSSSNSDWWWSW